MRYITFTPIETNRYDICFLVPTLNQGEMKKIYIDPHLGGQEADILAYDLHKGAKRTPVKEQREYLDELLPMLGDLRVKYLVVCDAEYFKTLTKAPSTDNALGYILDCAHPGFEHMQVLYCPNFRQVFYDPDKINANIGIALKALNHHRTGAYIDPGMDVIKYADYPLTVPEIESWLNKLIEMDCHLSSDIEGFSLKHWSAGIGSITFCWNQHEGIAFPVDLLEDPTDQMKVRQLLKDFFYRFHQSGNSMLWHNISYDVYVLIYQLFMKDLLDTEGLLEGMRILLDKWEDTKLITYLATNSCAGNKLGLKIQAQEFAGNYAVEDITDIRKIPLPELLEYNLVDGLSTWYVFEKHKNTMIRDQQLSVYEELFKPAILDVIQMQLTGLPLDRPRVLEVQNILETIARDASFRMQDDISVEAFVEWQTREAWEKDFADRKGKAKNPDKIKKKDWDTYPKKPFNPNSPNQLQLLLYSEDFFGLPVIDRTKTKAPATGGETLEKLLNHTKDQNIINLLTALIEYKALDKILTAFIPAFLEAPQGPDGWYYLFGNFNLGGTVSGRLSSSEPNLQNLPSNVTMKLAEKFLKMFPELIKYVDDKSNLLIGKLVKTCFKAPKGWLFVGLDYDSLEDRISALTTKDPNKLKVYTDGFDGHCLRAYGYFGDQMPDIDPNSVESINSIAKKYKPLRQESKAPTFALTYQGTYITLMNNCGFSEAMAHQIEDKYCELYKVSIDWVDAKLEEATKTGYVEVAFGLRVRTPLLHQVIRGTSRTPHEAAAEGRTAGNALGQSWGLLNNRAASEFMGKVRSSEYRLDIRPSAHIHDAQYYLIRDDMAVLRYVNHHLPEAVRWQDHPVIYHDQVKLSGEVSIFYPTWAAELSLPNDAPESQIKELAFKHLEKYSG